MKFSFEFDTESDDAASKICELREIEKLIIGRSVACGFAEGEDWLAARPEKSF